MFSAHGKTTLYLLAPSWSRNRAVNCRLAQLVENMEYKQVRQLTVGEEIGGKVEGEDNVQFNYSGEKSG